MVSGYCRRRTRRKSGPEVILAAPVHSSIAAFTNCGMATERIRLPLPSRSTNTARPSRICRWRISRAVSSLRRRPQPARTAKMARSRLPASVPISGRASNSRAWSRVSQFPALEPACPDGPQLPAGMTHHRETLRNLEGVAPLHGALGRNRRTPSWLVFRSEMILRASSKRGCRTFSKSSSQ